MRIRGTTGGNAVVLHLDAKKAKGKAKGERNGAAKLTEDDVRQIRRLYKPRQNTGALAVLFDVHRTTIERIVNGVDWGWLK